LIDINRIDPVIQAAAPDRCRLMMDYRLIVVGLKAKGDSDE